MAYTTIDDPSEYFTTTLYTGNGSDDRSITNSANAGNFKPDWLWVKQRNTTRHHILNDSNRGATKNISSSLTNAESTGADGIQAFETNGFQVGTDTDVNQNSGTYVAWQWKANGGTTSTNNDGNQTTTVQANTTAGFSIVTYEGTDAVNTYGHGLGAAPEFIVIKNYDQNGNWVVYHSGINFPTDDLIYLNLNEAVNQHNPTFNNTAPTSSVFTLGNYSLSNNSGDSHVAYCFTPIQGYSKFGKYQGNSNANGPFIYCGFKPAWVMVKRSDSANDWRMHDNKRTLATVSGRNPINRRLLAHDSGAEVTADGSESEMDLLSNGFKINSTSAGLNNSSGTYLYMAFAESPFVTSGGTPTHAK